MTYEESVNFLENLLTFGIKPGLQRINKLLEMLDCPQNKYKTIHVTGTNGKGSVCTMLAEILRCSKIKVGLFTSPHLISYCERIKVDGADISESEFANLVDVMKSCIKQIVDDGGESPTEFEVLTAMAFKYFADREVEYAVIEVGLGGLLDSTNIINPEVSVITNVANDHAEKCGGSLIGIARHKAGIIKQNIPVVTGAEGETLKIIRETAADEQSKIFVLKENFFVDESIKLSLQGEYQKSNAAIAIKTAQLIKDDRITEQAVNTALQRVHWAGRFEIFNVRGRQIIIDGAHNGAGAKVLRESLDKKFPSGRRIFLFGVLRDKDIESIIDNIFRENDFVIVTRPQSARSASPEDIAKLLRARSIECTAIEDNDSAFERFIGSDSEDRFIRSDVEERFIRSSDAEKRFIGSDSEIFVVAGSLYLIGYIRKLLLQYI